MTVSTLLGAGLFVTALGSLALGSQWLQRDITLTRQGATATSTPTQNASPETAAEDASLAAMRSHAQNVPMYVRDASWERFAQHFPR
jgi:hypothetical protein